jgi:hypothetical protein
MLPARQRNYDASLVDYLKSRMLAGTTHVDLMDGVENITRGQVSTILK